MLFSIIVPCYNEEQNIPLIFEKFSQALSDNPCKLELLLVNNGSTDGSANVFEQLLPKYPFARIVTVEKNQGYGYGILQGLYSAKGDYLGWTHADLQTDPKDVLKAINIVHERGSGNLYVKGNRKGRPFFDQFFTTGMSIFESFYLGEKLYDINAQPNIFPASFFKNWQNPPYDFALDLYALYIALKQGLEVIRFDVAFPPRIHGTSNWNTGIAAKYKFIKRTFDFSYKLKKSGIK